MGKACSTHTFVRTAYFTLVGKSHWFTTTGTVNMSGDIKIDRENFSATRRRDLFCLPLVLC